MDIDSAMNQKKSKKNKPFKKKMGGAMKRRFQYLKFKGLSVERAAELAAYSTKTRDEHLTSEKKALLLLKTKGQEEGGNRAPKRRKANTTLSPQEIQEGIRRTKIATTPTSSKQTSKQTRPSYSDTVKAIKIGVVPREHPTTKLSTEDMNSIISEIKQLIVKQRTGVIKPNCTRLPQLKAGWMVLHCEDKATAGCILQQNIGTSRDCRLVEEEDFPKEHVLVGYFQGSADDTNATILGMIQGQNNDLNAESWMVLHRENQKTCAVVTAEVDDTSMEQRKKVNYTVKYGFGQKVVLKRKGGRLRNHSESESSNQRCPPNPTQTQPSTSTQMQPRKVAKPVRRGEEATNKDAGRSADSASTSSNVQK